MAEADTGGMAVGNVDFLSELPIGASDHILSYLSEIELCGVACCSRCWRERSNLNSLWQPRCQLRGWERYGKGMTLGPEHTFLEHPFAILTGVNSGTLVPTGKWKSAFFIASTVEKNWAEFQCIKAKYRLQGHHWTHGRKDSSAFSCDGHFVAQVSQDGIHIQNLLYKAPTMSEYRAGAMQFLNWAEKCCSSTCTILLSKGTGLIISDKRDWGVARTFDCRAARWLVSFRCDYKRSHLLCFDGETVIGHCEKGVGRVICVWNSVDGTHRHTLSGHSREIKDLALSGDLAVSAAENLRLWDVDKGECLRTFECPDSVEGFTSCRIGSTHLLGGYNDAAMLFNLKTRSCITIHECKPEDMKFNSIVIACIMDSIVKVWNHGGDLIGTAFAETSHGFGLAGPRLALGHRSNWLDIWQVERGCIQQLVSSVNSLCKTCSQKVIWMDDTKLAYLVHNDLHGVYECISVFYFW